MSSAGEIYQIADELRSLASAGLHFVENDYDRGRYEKVQLLSARLLGAIEQRPAEEVLEEYQGNLSHMSPLIGAGAVVMREDKILLIQRSDNKLWGIPGGMVDVGETLTEATLRELHEETGLSGVIKRFLGIFDSRLWGTKSKLHLYHFVFKVEAIDQQPRVTSEAINVDFFKENELPPLHFGHDKRIPMYFKLLRGEIPIPYFDINP